MTFRKITKEDIDLIGKWNKARNRFVMSSDFYPENGVMAISEDGIEIACSFLYKTDSKFGVIAYSTSNPKANKREVHAALRKIYLILNSIGKKSGLGGIINIYGSRGMAKLSERTGYVWESRPHFVGIKMSSWGGL